MDLPSPGFRPILPAPSASSPGRSTDSGEGGGSGGGKGKGASRRRRQAPAACGACRRKKIKCSAERPSCRQCARYGVECVYDTLGSETPGEARQRRLGELQSRAGLYEELFGILRTRPERDIAAVVARIRAGADVEDVVRFVKEGDVLIQLSVRPQAEHRYSFPYRRAMPSVLLNDPNIPYTSSLLARGGGDGGDGGDDTRPGSLCDDDAAAVDPETWRMYRVPYHAAELVDPRISSVRASRWTAVTADDRLLQKLLQLYFAFDHPYFTFLHKDHFLEDMAAGRDRYCSSLLTNALLAQACRVHPDLPRRFSFWDPHALRNRFQAEARRLWDSEGNKARITTVQAAAIMALTSAQDTLDAVSDKYLQQAFAAGESLGLFASYAGIRSRARRRIYTVTAWGLHGFQGVLGFHFKRAPFRPRPPREPLPSYADAPAVWGELYVRYPRSPAPVSARHGEVARAIAELRARVCEITWRSFGAGAGAGAGDVALEDAMEYRESFLAWYNDLPQALTPHHAVLPAQLKVHMHYHNVLISIFSDISERQGNSSSSNERFVRGGRDHLVTPANIISESKLCLEALLRLYYMCHGFSSYDSTLAQFQWMVGESALQQLAHDTAARDRESRESLLSTLILAAVGLHESGRFCFVAQGILRILKAKMSPEVLLLLGRYLSDDEGQTTAGGGGGGGIGEQAEERQLALYNQSNLPLNVFSMRVEPDLVLKDMVKSFSGVSLEGDRGDGTASEGSDAPAPGPGGVARGTPGG